MSGLIGIELDQLVAIVNGAVKTAIADFESEKNLTRRLSSKEARQMLRISATQEWLLNQKGSLIPLHRGKGAGKGAPRYYLYSDVIGLMNKKAGK